jgi:ADP-ribose pyrophosphatase YjhB (NUDIX family)
VPTFKFCPACAARLPFDPAAPLAPQHCPSCGAVHYHNSKPTAGALIVRDGRVLLAARAIEPFKGYWDVPGGFLDPGEHPTDGARREVREETGLEVELGEPFAILIDRYAYGDGSDFTLNVYYLARIVAGEPRPADDVASLRWFSLDALPERIAFDHARELLDRLRRHPLAGL